MKQTKSQLKINDVYIKYSMTGFDDIPDELQDKLDSHPDLCSIGIDPGKNFGIAIVAKDGWSIMNGVLDDSTYTLREIAFWMAGHIVNDSDPKITIAVVEGASYGDRFGQVKLAEIRCGFALGISEKGIPVSIIAPKTPRKTVFGSGDIVAMDVWPTINHNAADALCLALYPFYKEAK
jgi:Holliday junction resolvasome RuvABC endonuclease subunit